MAKDTLKYIASFVLITLGLALCVAGIFVTPLLAMGVPVLTGGLSLLVALAAQKESIVIFRSRRSPRAQPEENRAVEVDPPVVTFSNNYHVGINNAAPTRPNTPSDSSFETAQESSHRSNMSNR